MPGLFLQPVPFHHTLTARYINKEKTTANPGDFRRCNLSPAFLNSDAHRTISVAGKVNTLK